MLAYLIAGTIGGLVGLSEIFSRYRDAPWTTATSLAGWLYVGFNVVAALLALALAREVFEVWAAEAGAGAGALRETVTQGSLAGLGAMAVLRSSLFTARVGGKDVEIGPAAMLEVYRGTIDRNVARIRAQSRVTEVLSVMGDVSFARSYVALTGFSLAVLQAVDAEERAALELQIDALANQTGRSDQDKALELGLILAGSVGFPALQAAKTALGSRIKNGGERPQMVAEGVSRLTTSQVLVDLPPLCLALLPDVRPDQQQSLRAQIDGLATAKMTDVAKRLTAGLVIVAVLGEEVFKAGVDLLAPGPASPPGQPPA